MAIFSKPANEQEPIPVGKHVAVLCDIIERKNIKTTYGLKDKLSFRFQLPECRGADGKPRLAFWSVNNSSSSKATLWKALDLWVNPPIPEATRSTFDLESLIGTPAEIHIKHSVVGDKVYANIVAILPAPERALDLKVDGYIREKDRADVAA